MENHGNLGRAAKVSEQPSCLTQRRTNHTEQLAQRGELFDIRGDGGTS